MFSRIVRKRYGGKVVDALVTKLDVVWNPLLEAFEAPTCPACGQPTFALRICRNSLGCDSCME
jgi:hypothetical protein